MATVAPLEAKSGIDNGQLFEVVNGEVVEIPPMGVLAGSLAALLASMMNAWARPAKIGWAVVEVIFDLGPGRNERRPDVAFVSRAKCPGKKPPPPNDPATWRIVPDAAIEVVSPSNTAEGIEAKVLEYFDAGVAQVWVIHPRLERIHVFFSPLKSDILARDDELVGSGPLDGFRLKLADLFDDAPPI